MSNVATLPAAIAADAPLPQRYEAARAAIAECERIGECKNWRDKAAAMASYAQQAKDDSLRVIPVRIQARAERRCGELLKQISVTPGIRTDLGSVPSRGSDAHGQGAAVPAVTRTQAVTDAGLSERQRKNALRIANVPEATFDVQVESPRPPSITQLANLGKETRPAAGPLSPWQDIECAETREVCETLERFVNYCEKCASVGIGRAV